MDIRKLQSDHKEWQDNNFPGHKPHHSLLGAVEELGELARAQLKMELGIRGSKEKHLEEAQDAVGDIVIFLMGYCSAMGFDFQSIVADTWAGVRRRDWRRYPTNGMTR